MSPHIFRSIFSLVLTLSATAVFSKNSTSAADDSLRVAPTNAVILREGSVITLKLTDIVSTADNDRGDVVKLEVYMDVKVNGITVIAAGTQATGTLTAVEKPGIYGAGGHLEMEVTNIVTVDGQRIPIRGGRVVREGKNRRVLAIAGSVALGATGLIPGAAPASALLLSGLVIKGRHAALPEGLILNASTGKDFVVKA